MRENKNMFEQTSDLVDTGMDHDVEQHLDRSSEGEGPNTHSRRDVLRAVGKYSAYLAGTSAVILSADEVLAAPKPCSQIGGNGNGNGPPRCR